ncbi:branched-chain amino acid ABC transporter permease [Terasakiispira papahanaumokuakeensis]|uniref:Branched-chain amino acid ABC transporter permease n=2 Tax=Terasakiispira papahanaumokuakeensis TaxID=197479 RepID=A0A1E2VE36_9GAMM|nr:branched-chain amino acid ABC transporter permease [Terasakiispira papahanaumokuakeensis]
MMPLSVAVVPWGVMVGAYGVASGLGAFNTQLLSLIVFAGTAQLVVIGMMASGLGLISILMTTALITSRHLLYSMALRERIAPLPWPWRYGLGFLLTDEFFVHCTKAQDSRAGTQADRWYMLGAGLSFYLVWNISTAIGIVAGHWLPDLAHWGLDFTVAAIFIAILFPNIQTWGTGFCVLLSMIIAVYCAANEMKLGLMIATISGMVLGYALDRWRESNQ